MLHVTAMHLNLDSPGGAPDGLRRRDDTHAYEHHGRLTAMQPNYLTKQTAHASAMSMARWCVLLTAGLVLGY